jgi:hypothetical protein
VALTRTAKHWLLGLLGAGTATTGYVVWRRHREHDHKLLGAPARARHYRHENARGHYGHHHHHHKEYRYGD